MPRSTPARLLVAGGALVLLLVLAYAASFALNSADVPRGVHVAGTDIGGLSTARARERLTTGLAARSAGPVRLSAEGQELALDPRTAGLSVDLERTLDQAASANPVVRLRGLFGGRRDIDPVSAVDDERLTAALTALAADTDRPVREGSIIFEGAIPKAVLPQAGRALQVKGAAEAVARDWLTQDRVDVPTKARAVTVTEQAVRTALAKLARPAVAGNLTLTSAKGKLLLTPADTASALRFVPGPGGALTPRVDGPALLTRLDGRLAAVRSAPADASFRIAGGKPVLVPAKAGQTVTGEQLAQGVLAAIRVPTRSAPLSLAAAQPKFTTAMAKALGIKQEIGTFTTSHPCCAPRVTNIQRMADLIDGALVLPGQTYSLNDDVGPRTRAAGFVDAPQIQDGEFVDGIGGGVSQFTTTMYNATFFAGMEDVEHTPHSYYISRYPEGREATITFPRPDLKWRNDSPTGVLITSSYTGSSITVTLYGTKRYDEVLSLSSGRQRVRPAPTVTKRAGPECSTTAGRVGFSVTITRVMKQAGSEVKRTSASHRYLPEPRVRCVTPKAPPPAPAPPPVIKPPTPPPAAKPPAPPPPAARPPAPRAPGA